MMRKQKYKDESHLLSVLWSLDPNAGYKGCMQYRSSHHWPPATNNTTHLYMSPSESNEEIWRSRLRLLPEISSSWRVLLTRLFSHHENSPTRNTGSLTSTCCPFSTNGVTGNVSGSCLHPHPAKQTSWGIVCNHHSVLSYWMASGAEGASCSISTQGGASSSGKVILSALYQTTRSTKNAHSINAPVIPANRN